jgi:hypothetical protein
MEYEPHSPLKPLAATFGEALADLAGAERFEAALYAEPLPDDLGEQDAYLDQLAAAGDECSSRRAQAESLRPAGSDHRDFANAWARAIIRDHRLDHRRVATCINAGRECGSAPGRRSGSHRRSKAATSSTSQGEPSEPEPPSPGRHRRKALEVPTGGRS